MTKRSIFSIILTFGFFVFCSCGDNDGKTVDVDSAESKVFVEYEIPLISVEILRNEMNWDDFLEEIAGGESEYELTNEMATIYCDCGGEAAIIVEKNSELQKYSIEIAFSDYDLCGTMVNGAVKTNHPFNTDTSEADSSRVSFQSFMVDDRTTPYFVHINNSVSSTNDPIFLYSDDEGEYLLKSSGVRYSSLNGISFFFSIEK